MIVTIKNKVGQKALEFLRTQRNLPLLFLVTQSASEVIVEVDDDDSDDLLGFLEAKGFDYENEPEESIQLKEKKKKVAQTLVSDMTPLPNNLNPISNPWPY